MAEPAMYSSALLYQAVMMLFLCLLFLFVWSRGCQRTILLDLHMPLLADDTPEHRIDAATREAEEGFVECKACSFENFKRFSHCTICGETLPVTEPESEASLAAGAPPFVKTSGAKAVPSARQLRARKRKEWTRQVDDQGRLSWDRNVSVSDYGSLTHQADPGFIVQFKKMTPEPKQETASVALVEMTSGDAVPLQDAASSVVVVETAGADVVVLDDEANDHTVVLCDALQADAALFPLGYTFPNDIDRRAEVVRMATLDFPSKYAHFVVTTSSQVVPAEVEFLKLSVHREYLLEESIDHMCCIKEKNIKSVMRINFLDEQAVDAGGVHREWIMLVNTLLADSELNLFVCQNRVDQSYALNPNSLRDVGEEHLKYYYATGRLIGRVLLEGGVWGFHLCVPLLKIILGQPICLADLEYFDPESYKSLRWLLDTTSTGGGGDGVESLALDFSVCQVARDGHVTIVDLIPNGRNIPVTEANKKLFVERKLQYLLVESVSTQLYALLKGIYEVIPQELLMLYDVEEFDYLMCGTDEIDVDDWKAHTTHSLNLSGTRVMNWFWEEVTAMPVEYKRRLLVFATGSARVPLSGFRGLTSYDGRLCPFTLKGVSYITDKYIMSHSCFNRLDLPLYKSRDELRTVLYAILDGDVYGFTSA